VPTIHLYDKLTNEWQWLGTEQNRFGRKTDKIAKYSIWTEKRNSQFWMEFGRKIGKWPTDRWKNCQNRLYSQKLATIVAENGDCTMLSIQFGAVFGDRLVHTGNYSRRKRRLLPKSVTNSPIVTSVDEALSPHFAVPPDCRLRWSAPSASPFYASGCRQTICLQLTRAVGLHAKTCWLHNKNLVETLRAL